MPGTRDAHEHGREAVHRDEHRGEPAGLARVEGPSDLAVVRVENRPGALFRLGGADVLIPRYFGVLAPPDDRIPNVQRPVAVDDQTGVPLGNGRCAESRSQALGHTGGADVPGDVGAELGLGQPQRAERTRNQSARVVTDDEERRAPIAATEVDRRDVVGGEQHDDIMTDRVLTTLLLATTPTISHHFTAVRRKVCSPSGRMALPEAVTPSKVTSNEMSRSVPPTQPLAVQAQ
jgi:hypothetical protein